MPRRLHFARSASSVNGERASIALRRFLRGSDAAQKNGTRGMQHVTACEVAVGDARIDERQRGSNPINLDQLLALLGAHDPA